MPRAILIQNVESEPRAAVQEIDETALPPGDVLVQIERSTLNYKDALAITGKAPVVRRFPMVPGIDFAGRVTSSAHAQYKAGELVVLNGWGVGEAHWGGLAQAARVSGDWLVPLPREFTSHQAMAIGTAGYTAMLCILALERHGITPDHGKIVVTGAAGGVGSISIAILSKLGYHVVAVSGRPEEGAYFNRLGVAEIVDRTTLSGPGKSLGKELWAGAIDTVGGQVLANVCASMRYRGVVAACGMAGGMAFPATVAPFILRGVTLAGVDSVMCPRPDRFEAWRRLARDLDVDKLGTVIAEIGLEDAIATAPAMLEGRVRGRLVVDVNR